MPKRSSRAEAALVKEEEDAKQSKMKANARSSKQHSTQRSEVKKVVVFTTASYSIKAVTELIKRLQYCGGGQTEIPLLS